MSTKPLKALNTPALWGVVSFDICALALFEIGPALLHDAPLSRLTLLRVAFAGVAPVLVLLLNTLVPAALKAMLVYWRWREVLPGHRAFTQHAHGDPRIDLVKLKKNVGTFPDDAQEQNAKWYSLLKKVEAEPAVSHAHKQFLLLRDVAAISLLLLACAGGVAVSGLVPMKTWAPAATLFTVQYLLAAIGARHQGNGLVTSVLALHSVKRRV